MLFHKQKIPDAIVLVLLYFFFSILLELIEISQLFNHVTDWRIYFGPFYVEGIVAPVYRFTTLILDLFCIVSIITRSNWSRTLALIWVSFRLLMNFIDVILLLFYYSQALQYFHSDILSNKTNLTIVILLLVSVIIPLNYFVARQLWKNKSFFSHQPLSAG
jgi:hypothetical protein